MRQLYRIATKTTKLTGEEYVVDHIFPLQADNSCGLHVPWNLRVITRYENAAKHNTVPDERGYAFDPDWGKWTPSEGAA
jgi:5-methylcytosine-specific restriction endonuclease McrA